MGLAGQNQVRHMYVGSDSVARADVATLRTSGSAGELLALNANGGAIAAGEAFKFYLKTADGIVSSDIIKPENIISGKLLQYAAKTLKIASSGVLPTPVAGQIVTAEIVISGFGSMSIEDEYVKKGFYKVVTGDAQGDVVDGLITSLNRNFIREVGSTATTNVTFTFSKGHNSQELTVDTAPDTNGNATVTVNGTAITVALLAVDTASDAATKIAAAIDAVTGYTSAAVGAVVTVTADNGGYVSVSLAGGATNAVGSVAGVATKEVLVITEKEQPNFDKDKRTRKQTHFTANVSGLTTAPGVVYSGGYPGVGTSQQVQDMEFYLMGERGDFYRGAGYPHNFDQSYQAVAGTNYNLIELAYFEEGRDEAKKSKKQVTLAIPFVNLAGNANINLIAADVNTATGKTTLTPLATA